MRKTHKDYKKEYNDLKRKQKGLESRIRERTKEMVDRLPDVMMNGFESNYSVSKQFQRIQTFIKPEYQTEQFLRIIKVIEEYNEKKSNIKQLKMFEDNERKNN
jgi:hypothetical protein